MQNRECLVGRLSLFSLLHSLFFWVAQAEPTWPLHLLVIERNTAVRRFYERRGAALVESPVKGLPDGSTPRVVRYQWRDPARLLAEAPAGAYPGLLASSIGLTLPTGRRSERSAGHGVAPTLLAQRLAVRRVPLPRRPAPGRHLPIQARADLRRATGGGPVRSPTLASPLSGRRRSRWVGALAASDRSLRSRRRSGAW